MASDIQIKIGENGEVVELPLTRYEELLGYEDLVRTSVVLDHEVYNYLVERDERLTGLEK